MTTRRVFGCLLCFPSSVLRTRRASSAASRLPGTNHLGFQPSMAVSDRWNLPPELCRAVAKHHMHDDGDGEYLEAATVHIADIIANALRMGSSGNHFVPDLNERAWQCVGLAVSDLDDIVSHTEERLGEVIAVFIEG